MSLYTDVYLMVKLYFVLRYITVNHIINDRSGRSANGKRLHNNKTGCPAGQPVQVTGRFVQTFPHLYNLIKMGEITLIVGC